MPNRPAAAALLALAAAARPAAAQSPFSTAEADGSIILDRGGFVQTTFSDALFRVGYEADWRDRHADAVRRRRPEARVRFGPRLGFEVQARPGGNVAALLDANELVSGGRALVSFGLFDVLGFQPSRDELLQSARAGGNPPAPPLGLVYDWLTLQASVERRDVRLYDASRPFAEQFSTRKFEGYSVTLHYNAEFGGRVPAVLGVAFGVRRVDNADELAEVTTVERRTIASPDGSTQRTAERTRKGLSGPYAASTPAVLNTDLVFYPFLAGGATGTAAAVKAGARASVALNLFTRSTFDDEARVVPGVGAYLTAPGAPLKVYGGVNVFRTAAGEAAANVVAGFNF